MVIHVPIALGLLDVATASQDDGQSRWMRWSKPVRNPIVVAALLGLLVNVTGLELPAWVLDPIDLLAAKMIPVAVLVFGMWLRGMRISREIFAFDTLVATFCKLVVHPLAALTAGLLLGLPPKAIFALVVLAAVRPKSRCLRSPRSGCIGINTSTASCPRRSARTSAPYRTPRPR